MCVRACVGRRHHLSSPSRVPHHATPCVAHRMLHRMPRRLPLRATACHRLLQVGHFLGLGHPDNIPDNFLSNIGWVAAQARAPPYSHTPARHTTPRHRDTPPRPALPLAVHRAPLIATSPLSSHGTASTHSNGRARGRTPITSSSRREVG